MAEPELTFFYELGSPYAYLAGERIEALLGRAVTWKPVLLGAIFELRGRGSWGLTDDRDAGIAEIERRAEAYGLPPVVWPEGWPKSTLWATRAAVYADERGRSREFAQAAMRAAFQEGRDLTQLREIDQVATAARLDAVRVVEELNSPRIKDELRARTAAAWDAGVRGAPTVLVEGGGTYFGDDQLAQLAADLAA